MNQILKIPLSKHPLQLDSPKCSIRIKATEYTDCQWIFVRLISLINVHTDKFSEELVCVSMFPSFYSLAPFSSVYTQEIPPPR